MVYFGTVFEIFVLLHEISSISHVPDKTGFIPTISVAFSFWNEAFPLSR